MVLVTDIRNYPHRDGSSQEQRLLEILDPSKVEIDGRKLEDFLVFLQRYARQIVYINHKLDSPIQEDSWEPFFNMNPTFVIAAIEKTNPLLVKERMEGLFIQRPAYDVLYEILGELINLAYQIEAWRKTLGVSTSFKNRVEQLIKANLLGLIQQLTVFENELYSKDTGIAPLNDTKHSRRIEQLEEFGTAWNASGNIERFTRRSLQDPLAGHIILSSAQEILEDVFTVEYNVFFEIVRLAPDFFMESGASSNHPPHIALFISFLRLYDIVRKDLNTISKKHLDYFYEDVLQIKRKKAVPDSVHLFVELAKHVGEHEISQDTAFDAGPDEAGLDRFYKQENTLVANKAQITEFKTLFVEPGNSQRVLAAPFANSLDGQGEEFVDVEIPSWKTLGHSMLAEEKPMPAARYGFLISSKALLLADGTREITVDIHYSGADELLVTSGREELIEKSNQLFELALTGEEEWIEEEMMSEKRIEVTGNIIKIYFKLKPEVGPVTALDAEVLGEEYGTQLPSLKVIVNPDSHSLDESFGYQTLKDLKITKIAIVIDVDGSKNVLLQNDDFVLDPNKPFHPFGVLPRVGSSFYVGSAEAFQKSLSKMVLDVTWAGVPTNFVKYYEAYPLPTKNSSLTISRIGIDQINRPAFIESHFNYRANINKKYNTESDPLEVDGSLLRLPISQVQIRTLGNVLPANINTEADTAVEFESLSRTYTFYGPNNGTDSKRLDINRILRDDDSDRYNAQSKSGFLKFTLTPHDFLHTIYPSVLARQTLAASTYPDHPTLEIPDAEYSDSDTGNGPPFVPNPPYTPIIENFSISYTAEATTDHSQEEDEDKDTVHLVHIHPFGYEGIKTVGESNLLPQFEDEGTLFLGIQNFKPGQGLSILFQFSEGTADADADPAFLEWKYLVGNEWKDIKDQYILEEDTDGFVKSGIVTLALPRDLDTNHTVVPANLHWIKAATKKDADAVSELRGVHTQALKATYADPGTPEDEVTEEKHIDGLFLPAEEVAGLAINDANVTGVSQLYPSFGGRPKEKGPSFYLRVSEHLRHKGRAITLFDYERLILERFPELYKVKCINHARVIRNGSQEFHELAPGHVVIAVIPDFTRFQQGDRFQPKVTRAKLNEIRDFVLGFNCPFVYNNISEQDGGSVEETRLFVKNPLYQEIDFSFDVAFTADVASKDFQKEVLKNDIIRFLSPWAFDNKAKINFGGRFFKSTILDFVEKQLYVDYVLNFNLKRNNQVVDFIEAETPRSILVPQKDYSITVEESCPEGRPIEHDSKLGFVSIGEQTIT